MGLIFKGQTQDQRDCQGWCWSLCTAACVWAVGTRRWGRRRSSRWHKTLWWIHSQVARRVCIGHLWVPQSAKMSTHIVPPPGINSIHFCVSKKASLPKNKNWMNHLRVPQRVVERLLLARMESRNHFLKNPRFFPPNTPCGGKSLIFPPRKPALRGEVPSRELEQRCVFPWFVFSENRTL